MRLVSVVVTTKNEEKYLEKCLLALKRQTYKPIEIVVSDACSTDATLKIAQRHADRVVVKKTNIAEGKNFGASKARGQILVFLDADTLLPKNWVERAVKNLDSKGFTTGVIKPRSRRLVAKFVCWWWGYALPWFFLLLRSPMFGGASTFCVKREVFEEVGGFDSSLAVFEDADLVRKIGAEKIRWDPELRSYTSMRRFERNGYFKQILFYVGCAILFLLSKKLLSRIIKSF